MPSRLVTVTCPTCRGSGRRGNRECDLCEGKRFIEAIEGSDDDD